MKTKQTKQKQKCKEETENIGCGVIWTPNPKYFNFCFLLNVLLTRYSKRVTTVILKIFCLYVYDKISLSLEILQ